MRVPLLVIAAVVAANGAARSQPQAAPDPGPCTFDELVDGGTFARDLRDTTAARQRREADWNTLDRMVGAPLRRVYENIDAVELIGWNQLPATRRPDGRTPAEMWLQVNDNYGTARTYLGIGQIYDYAIDPGPPFSVRVDTTYVAEPAGTRRRSVGVDVFTPGGCVISLRIAGAPNSPRLAPGAVAAQARCRAQTGTAGASSDARARTRSGRSVRAPRLVDARPRPRPRPGRGEDCSARRRCAARSRNRRA
jgi:hypothetical protein